MIMLHVLSFSQNAYINTLLHCFNLEDCKPLAQPLSPHVLFLTDQCPTTVKEKAAMQAVPYCKAIGVLNWIAVGTWPDIVFVVGQLVHFMENPGHIHWEAVKCVFWYLKGMLDWKLVYGGGENWGLEGFTDACQRLIQLWLRSWLKQQTLAKWGDLGWGKTR